MENHTPISKIIMRLAILKNYITLGDIDDMQREAEKLSQSSDHTDVKNIIFSIQSKEFSRAIALIDSFINTHHQLSVWIDPEIAALQTEIEFLENRVISLDNEKTDMERILVDFQRRYILELGDIILQLLSLRKLKFREDEQKFNEAEQDEKEYREQLDLEKGKDVFVLSAEQEAELKKKFRKAVILCHPDKFANESTDMQQEAEAVSKELIEACDRKDLNRVAEILANLEKGFLKTQGGTATTDKVKLQATINRLKIKCRQLELLIQQIGQSENYKRITEIDNWDSYFIKLKEQLNAELNTLKQSD
jgi:hypothetical protein